MNDESPPAFNSPSIFDLKQHQKVKPGKVTKILQYKNTHLGIVTLSTGQVVVVNFVKQTVLNIIKSHAGSINTSTQVTSLRLSGWTIIIT
jgi:hypothetical protein